MRTLTGIQSKFPLGLIINHFKRPAPLRATDGIFQHFLKLDRLRILAALLLLLPGKTMAGGTWTALASGPPAGINNCMLMSDGTVLGMNGSGVCVKLTPDIHGNYINGTWTTLASMNSSRLFFSSQLLTNGNLWVAGGEDGSGGSSSELYNPLINVWTLIPPPAGGYPGFSDSISEILPDGNPLVAPVSESGGCLIYNVVANTWQTAASCNRGSQDEADWVKLPSDNILTIDAFSQNSEHYVPTLNEWVNDGGLPAPMYDSALGELGTGHLLPNGKVFWMGSTTNTAFYTPGATATNAGSWVAGPVMVFGTNFLGQSDAPAAMMPNGKILCCLGPSATYNGPCFFYEYDYTVNTFTQVGAPGGGTTLGNTAPFGSSMLDLPDGTVLFMDGQNAGSLYIYTPDGTPLAAGQPVINSIAENVNGSYQLSGTGLNGISEGAAYGDDEQMNGNYPLVRMTNNSSGNVYYARTFNWNSTSVQTGSRPVTTQFTLPQGLPSGTYSLVVTAVGNPSAAQTFNYSPPAAPAGLTAASGSNAYINLHWTASAGATFYNVKKAPTSGGYFVTLATVTGTNYTDTGLTNGIEYFYKVAAIGRGGPSSDSAAVGGIPAGPPLIPGATQVSLAAYYNRTGIYTDGKTFTTGVDGSYSAYSANLLGPSLFWNNLVFDFGPSNAADVVYCASQTITLPAGRFNTLQMLATGVQGSQTAQTFTVTYTDNSTATFTQSFSDWANPQSYPGEFTLITMPYRDLNSGGNQTLNVTVDGYLFTLDQTRTVKSLTLPNNSDVVILSIMLANDPVSVPMASYYNRAGIYTDGTTFTNPATGGLDGGGEAYSGTLLGGSQTWSNALFVFGPMNATNVISCSNQTITLPPGNYSRLDMLATGVQGGQTSQSFVVTYTDATTSNITQSLSDWFTSGNFTGESKAVIMDHRNNADGTADNRTFNLYGYSFAINNAKVVQSITLPNDGNVIITAISLVPNWAPTFSVSPFTMASDNAGRNYSGSIATNASDLNGDALTFAKVSGPSWLIVAANGALSGQPQATNVGTNSFVVSVTDSGGLSNTAPMYIYINGPPSFTLNPFTMPAINAGQNYSGTIASNATDPNPGDVLTFAKLGGPPWLSVAANGALSGVPANSNANTNTFLVSVTDSGGLAATATMSVYVNGAPSFNANPFTVPGIVAGQNYSSSIASYATDPNPGDALTFAKIAGPSWLAVAPSGALSGTPYSVNLGTNNFLVSVTDSGGLSSTGTMNLAVTPAAPIISTISFQSNGLFLSWTGGIAPYQVQATSDLVNSNWQNLGGTITSNSLSIAPTNSAMFYQVIGQ